MLYHVPNITLALSEVRRVLKADGSFMAATNGEHHMTELDQLLESFNPVYQGEHAMSSRFTLQNGENQLFEFFDEVALHPYQSDLWVTDAGLLCDYAWSTPKVQLLFRPEQKKTCASSSRPGFRLMVESLSGKIPDCLSRVSHENNHNCYHRAISREGQKRFFL